MPTTTANTPTYTADNMTRLEGLNIVRTRPGMYIGGTDSDALIHLLWEALDNAVDEHLVGHGDLIKITLHEDGSLQVDDSGRGIPTGVNKETKETGLEMAFGLHSGGKFDQKAYSVSGGLNGVGIAAAAALSDRLDGIVYRDGKQYTISFQKGVKGTFKGEGVDAEFTPKPKGISTKKDSRPAAEQKTRPSGTTIRWYPDFTIFDNDEESGVATLDLSRILARVENTAYLCPGLTLVLKDEQFSHKEYSFNYPDGFRDLLKNMAKTELIGEPIFYNEETTVVTRGMEKRLEIEVGVQWEKGFDVHNASYVNIIETPSGGTHVSGTQKGLEEAVLKTLTEKNMLRAKDPVPELVDITEGINLIVNVKLPEPGYSTQTKERLKEASVSTAARRLAESHIYAWLNSRKNSNASREVLEKIIAAARTRRAKNAQFDVTDVLADVSSLPVFSRKPENLKECQHTHDPRSELMIVEGSSALGTLLKARSAAYQAIFPLKGKPRNVYGLKPESLYIPPSIKSPRTPAEKRMDASRKKFLSAGHILLQNKELDDLVKVLGAGFGDSFDIEEMRYHRVIVVADADVDGGHIESLLVGFFATYMPALIEDGRLYFACPPLFVVKAGKESKPDTLLASNDQELAGILEQCKKEKKPVINVARRKGHGESSVEEAFEYIMNPATRTLKRIMVEDAKEAQRVLELTLGNDAGPRKEWISDPKTRELINAADLV